MSDGPDFTPACPIPITDYPRILLAHGGGGALMHQLIDRIFIPTFGSAVAQDQHDAAVVRLDGHRLALTTDSYVVHPLFFPGGDIGSLAVHGTVNDLAMAGARPLYLTAGFILEEGLPMDTLWNVVRSMQGAAESAGVQIICGDTKVVDRGKGDGVFINTAGVGVVEHDGDISPKNPQAGDVVIISGDIGRHGIAIMSAREGLAFETTIESDSAAVHGVAQALFEAGVQVRCMRDLTRGGLASALNEIARACGRTITIEETAVPVREDVRGACEVLGLDPLYVACEGRFVVFVSRDDADRACAVMRGQVLAQGAVAIGAVTDETRPLLTMRSTIGSTRIVDMLSGEQLPRIC